MPPREAHPRARLQRAQRGHDGGVLALGVCDLVFARRTKGRYFALHVICNVWISVLSAPDLYQTFSDPLVALAQSEVNHWPTALVFSIHVYHMLFFKRCARDFSMSSQRAQLEGRCRLPVRVAD